MKLKKQILKIVFFCAMWFGLQNVCYAGSQRLNSLNYEVKLRENGNMEVVEIWDISIRETNTLFKDFELDSSKYSGITDVKVKNLTVHKELKQIDEEMYHVPEDCYYGLETSSGKFEIAWGVGLEDSSDTRTYEISYTVEDVVMVYEDCSELCWQFIGTENGIYAENVTGTVTLPKTVQDMENLRVWAHGPLHGQIERVAEDLVSFHVKDFDAKTMLEIRIVIQEDLFPKAKRILGVNSLEKIIMEETKWADIANQARNKSKVILGIGMVFYVAIFAFLAKKIGKYRRELNMIPPKPYSVEVGKYFRDIPRQEEATPAEAAFLYYWRKSKPESNVLSATMLQLALKGYVSFEIEKKEEIKINLMPINPLGEKNQLKTSEEDVLKLLKRIAGSGKTSFTMKDMKSFAKNFYDEFGRVISGLEIDAKNEHMANGNFDSEKEKMVRQYQAKIIAYIVGIIVSLMALQFLQGFIFPIWLECIWCIFLQRKILKRIPILTEKGETERQQWKGLKKFMEDFSLLDTREIPDLVLWEKYLVYATVFGISDKVIEQLKVVYQKEMLDFDNNSYIYLNLMRQRNFSGDFISELNKATGSAYSTYRTAYATARSVVSSGSGGGGGFSGGGGCRWRRRPEWGGR